MIGRQRRRHGPDWVWNSPPSERVALFESDTASAVRTILGTGPRVILATHATRFDASLDDEDRRHLLGWNRFDPRASADCLLQMEKRANVLLPIGSEGTMPIVDLATAIGGRPAPSHGQAG